MPDRIITDIRIFLKYLLSVFLLATLSGQDFYAQSVIDGVVNQYAPIDRIYNLNNSNRDSVIVQGASSIWDGSDEYEIALFIQMKGTLINDPDNNPSKLSWGVKKTDNNSGKYCFMLVDRVVGDSLVIFSHSLTDMELSPTVPQSAQLVKVPYAKSFTLDGDIYAKAWDPVSGTGGVVALFASDSINLSGHHIDVTSSGFRGGDTARDDSGPVICSSLDYTYYLDSADHYAGRKGESTVYSGYHYTRGNGFAYGGGGGGQGRFSGGGGGSNYGAGAPGGFYNQPSCLNNLGGKGGFINKTIFDNVENRIFLGSGGGSSVPEPGVKATPGGNGGGIVIIITDVLVGGSAADAILAKGQSVDGISDAGGGGGGAGGFIILDINKVSNTVQLDVSGGKGGDSDDILPEIYHGPGGGGGGGIIWQSGSDILSGLIPRKLGGGNGFDNGEPNGAGSAEGGESLMDLVLPLRGFSFNFISGDEDVCQDTIPTPIIGSIPKGDTGFVYIWQDSISGSAWQTIPAASGDNASFRDYSGDTLTVTTWYRRIVTKKSDLTQSDTSQYIEKTVFNRLQNNLIAAGDTICYDLIPAPMNQAAPPITGGDGVERLYQWQAWQSSSPAWVDAGSLALGGISDQAGYVSGNLLETTYFRRQLISHVCTHISDSLTVIVLPDITDNQITGNDRVCQFTTPVDSLKGPKPGGGDLKYEYVWEASSDLMNWDSINTDRNYFPGSMDKVTTSYRRRVYSGKDRTCKSISDTVVILVDPIIQQNSIAPDTAVCAETLTNDIYPDKLIIGGDGDYLYTFEKSLDSLSWTEARAANAENFYNPFQLSQTTWYRRIVESGACLDTTRVIRFYVDTVIINNLISTDDTILLEGADTICAGTYSGILKGTIASGGDWSGYTYIWDKRDGKQGWTTGVHTAQDLPPQLLYDSTWFQRRVLSGVCVDTSSEVVVNVHDTITGNLIRVDDILSKDACTMLPKLLRGQNETDGLLGGTGIPADYLYAWKKYDKLSGLWIDAPSGGSLSKDKSNYETEILSDAIYGYKRYVISGKCSHLSDSLTLIVKPRPIGMITSDTVANEECFTGSDIRIIVPVDFSVGLKPFTLYYSDGQGLAGSESMDTYSGDFSVSRSTADSTWYTIRIDSIVDEYGCRAIMPEGGTGSRQTIIYKDLAPEIIEEMFSVCGELAEISVVAGLGSLKYWGPDSADYSISPLDNPTATFTLGGWKNDTIVYPLVWSQKNGVCPMNSVSVRVELFQEPSSASMKGGRVDSTIYFRQFLPMWADTVSVGLGTWIDQTWPGSSGNPITDIHNNNAVANLGGDNMQDEIIGSYTWEVSNGECPTNAITVGITRRDLVMYTAFSPNGDLFNEYLILDGLEFADKFTMKIFSRQMILVKTVTQADVMVDPHTGEQNVVWDGRMEDDSEAADGTYFYMIEVEHAGEKYSYKNYLELIRADPMQ